MAKFSNEHFSSLNGLLFEKKKITIEKGGEEYGRITENNSESLV